MYANKMKKRRSLENTAGRMNFLTSLLSLGLAVMGAYAYVTGAFPVSWPLVGLALIVPFFYSNLLTKRANQEMLDALVAADRGREILAKWQPTPRSWNRWIDRELSVDSAVVAKVVAAFTAGGAVVGALAWWETNVIELIPVCAAAGVIFGVPIGLRLRASHKKYFNERLPSSPPEFRLHRGAIVFDGFARSWLPKVPLSVSIFSTSWWAFFEIRRARLRGGDLPVLEIELCNRVLGIRTPTTSRITAPIPPERAAEIRAAASVLTDES